METAVHVLAVVHRLPYVRQIFEKGNGIFDGLSVLHDLAGDAVEHVVYLVPQAVTEGFCYTLTSAFLKPLSSGEVGLTEQTNSFAFVGPQFATSWRTVVVAVTHRDE